MTKAVLCVPHDALRVICTPVTAFDADLFDFAQDLLAAMYAANGRGLAAPQVGSDQRIFVMDETWKDGTRAPRVYVNPQIVMASDAVATNEESCLSIPKVSVEVTRPAKVTLEWQDVGGGMHQGEFSGIAAAIVQHERDHLDGILCTDYVVLP